jgi:hypothetical protein
MARPYLLVSSSEAQPATRAVFASPCEIDGGRRGRRTLGLHLREPRLAARMAAESGCEVLSRIVQAFRALASYTHALLVGIEVLDASSPMLDRAGLLRSADDIERASSL